MNHRVVNDVGYKKIYPMSLWEDDSFCHYCGRKASILNGLEWDHVPALNVKIPEEFTEIRKTLVRACRECNNMASDTPHLDYLERHFWLKAAYLRRYKSFIIQGVKEVDSTAIQDSYLLAVIHNSKIKYEEILNAIGFGIKDIDQIQSPILEVKTKKGQKISTLLINYLHGVPSEVDEETEPQSIPSTENNLIVLEPCCTYKEFIDFLVDERLGNSAVISDGDDYLDWLKNHPTRANTLELPEDPIESYKIGWPDIIAEVEKAFNQHKNNDELDIFNGYEKCSYHDFINFLIEVPGRELFTTVDDYIDWCYENSADVMENRLPEFPIELYGKSSWEEIMQNMKEEKRLRRKNK